MPNLERILAFLAYFFSVFEVWESRYLIHQQSYQKLFLRILKCDGHRKDLSEIGCLTAYSHFWQKGLDQICSGLATQIFTWQTETACSPSMMNHLCGLYHFDSNCLEVHQSSLVVYFFWGQILHISFALHPHSGLLLFEFELVYILTIV